MIMMAFLLSEEKEMETKKYALVKEVPADVCDKGGRGEFRSLLANS